MTATNPNPAIRGHLAQRGLKQSDLGVAVGLPQSAVSARLLGRTPWRLDELDAVVELLGISLVELLAEARHVELVDVRTPAP